MDKIVLDCFGGDHAPEEIVKGGLMALDVLPELKLVMTGKKQQIEDLIDRHSGRIEIIDANEVVTNEDSPTESIKKKTDSSMVRAFDALKEREDVGGIV